MPPRTEVVLIKCCFAQIEVGFDSFLLNIYIAPLQENYSEALPTPARLKRADDCPSPGLLLAQTMATESPAPTSYTILFRRLRHPGLPLAGIYCYWPAIK